MQSSLNYMNTLSLLVDYLKVQTVELSLLTNMIFTCW